MPQAKAIKVDFSKAMPVFPLASTVLLPHAVQGLHIFEPRYRQMVEACIEQAKGDSVLSAMPIAMATIDRTSPARSGCKPILKPAVCIGQIVQHERLADGHHTIVLHGVCRAHIVELQEPKGERLYRQAMVRPIEPLSRPMPRMPEARRVLKELLHRERVQRFCSVKAVSAWAEREELPTHAVVELVGSALIQEERLRYALLECADPWERARMVARTLVGLESVMAGAEAQRSAEWPKGLSWN